MPSKSKIGIGVVIGAVAGTIAGLFLAPKAGRDLQKDAKKIYDDLKDKDPNVVIKQVFGVVSKESQELYKASKERLADELADLKENYKTIDSAKYAKIVGDVVAHIKDEHNLPEDQLKALGTHLQGDFKKLFLAKNAKSASKSIKKPAAKKK